MLSLLVLAPVVTAQQVRWTQSGVPSVAHALGYVYRVYVDDALAGVLAGVACAGVAPTVTCQAPALPASLVLGARSQLTAQDPVTLAESARSAPYVYQGPPQPCVLAGTAYSPGFVLWLGPVWQVRAVVTTLQAAGFQVTAIRRGFVGLRVRAVCLGG